MKLKNKITISIITGIIFTITLLIPIRNHTSQNKSPAAITQNKTFQPLKHYLVKEGLSASYLDTLFSDTRIEYYPNVLINKHKLPSYSSVETTKRTETKFHKYNLHHFINEYSEYFEKAWNMYGVDKESICAVLYVETKFGSQSGKHSTLNILISLAMADQEFALEELKKHVEQKYHYMPNHKREYIKEYYTNYAKRKANRARKELAILLKLARKGQIEARSLTGSYAGAFGYPQFLPSSYAKYAVDGDKNGKIDLFTFPDAILSVGNFLQNHGWSPHIYAQKRALRRYNNSSRYVADVLNVARYFDQQPN
ncbi:MAG: lytic murein transglycosylase [Candidatus Marinimicrobia bacterium]|nr:lytic murein transglycosylase [Candidatus Neomarinimicrobiota bacterium]